MFKFFKKEESKVVRVTYLEKETRDIYTGAIKKQASKHVSFLDDSFNKQLDQEYDLHILLCEGWKWMGRKDITHTQWIKGDY